MTVKVMEFAQQLWDCLILDEAQAKARAHVQLLLSAALPEGYTLTVR